MSNKLYSEKQRYFLVTEDEQVTLSLQGSGDCFNGVKKEQIGGEYNNQISAFIFEKLNAAGVATHFYQKISDTDQLNKKVDIIPLEVVPATDTAGSQNVFYEEGIAFIESYYKMMIWMIRSSNDEYVKFLKIWMTSRLLTLVEETCRINELLKAYLLEIGLKLIDLS